MAKRRAAANDETETGSGAKPAASRGRVTDPAERQERSERVSRAAGALLTPAAGDLAGSSMVVEDWEIERLIPYDKNARINENAIGPVAVSIQEFGFRQPIVVDEAEVIIIGHTRRLAAMRLGLKTVPVHIARGLTPDRVKALRIADNKTNELAGWDMEKLTAEIAGLRENDFDLTALGFDVFELGEMLNGKETAEAPAPGTPETESEQPSARGIMADKFMIPPFTIFDSCQGWWMNRKKQWLALGIKSEESRTIGDTGRAILMGGRSGNMDYYGKKTEIETALGRKIENREFEERFYQDDAPHNQGVSIFDPVLAEIAYRWFSPPSGQVVDPFAGGSVRGVVAAVTGRKYWGCDLRPEQIAANRRQGGAIIPENMPQWVSGDSRNELATAPEADFIFSCPPYGSLEKYSDDPADLSAMTHPDFLARYEEIVRACFAKLRENRFACFIVGDFRDAMGNYRGFPGDTVRIFERAGFRFYNDAVLVTQAGSLPVRISGSFPKGRKLGKRHQNVLVFLKGDAREAVAACGEIDVSECLPGETPPEIPGGE